MLSRNKATIEPPSRQPEPDVVLPGQERLNPPKVPQEFEDFRRGLTQAQRQAVAVTLVGVALVWYLYFRNRVYVPGLGFIR